MNAFLAVLALAPTAPQTSEMRVGDSYLAAAGIQMATLNVPAGSVSVYLPGDLMGGDTISGSVFASPTGEGETRAANAAALMGMTLDVMGQKVKLSDRTGFTVAIPSDAQNFRIGLADAMTTATAEINLAEGMRVETSSFLAPVTNENGPITLLGTFDGARATTSAKINGQSVPVLTESPRRLTLSAAGLGLGRHALSVAEGLTVLGGEFNVARATLVPGKLRGGKTDLKMMIEGLGGMSASEFPLSLGVISETPKKLRFEPSGETYTVVPVSFDQVVNGTWLGKTKVKLSGRGEFMTNLLVASDQLLSRLR